ncbi:MAG: Ig-like domain-containing protein, partial [Pyrinomonadaceae bacterium]
SMSNTSSSIYFGQNANLSVSATDADGVALVEFYASRDPLNGSAADPPVLIGVAAAPGTDGKYHLNWVLPPAGYYHVNARATDATGSSTLTYASTLVVWQKATVNITNPTGGAVFKQPTNITLTAAAQTNNGRSDEYIERLDFYDGTRWIGQGTNTAWQAPWSFVWQNAPAGTHNITAQASSTLTGLSISAPVVVVVNPEHDPEPDPNVKPVVALTSPVPLTNFAAGAPVPVAATATDGDGTINRVEFRANGFTVEVDTTAPYTADLNLPGGTHDITAVAFDNSGGSTVSLPARVTIDRTPGPQLTSTQWDGQSQFGPSIVTRQGAPVDQELADDFNLVGDIDRIVVGGTRGFGAATNPVVRGAYVRFYAWQNGSPGALQDEQYLAAGDPGLVFDAGVVSTVDVRLPHSFRAAGKHFVSVQLVVEGYNSYWYWNSCHTGSPQNAPVRVRDNYAASPAWTNGTQLDGTINADAVMQLYGSLITPASLTSVAPQTVERSGWFVLTGTNFGATQGASRVLVDKLAAIVVKWSPTEIIGYVPEGASLGAVEVVVSNPLGTSNALQLNVTNRKSVGRIRWQAKYLGDYVTYRPAVAPAGSPDAGSVYLEVDGLVYAWSPTGALKWVARPGGYVGYLSIGGGQISVGPEGNVYVAESAQPAGPGTPFRMAVTALDGQTGAVKWRNIDSTATLLYAGPQVGPDGKVYAVFAPGQYNTVAFNPDGTVAWTRDDHLNSFLSGPAREMAFGRSLPRFYFSGGLPLIASDFAGARLWSVNNGTADKPAVGADENLRVRNSALSAQTGATLYTFAGFGQGPTYPAAAGPDNTHYIINNYYRLFALGADGTEKWHYDEHDFNGTFGSLSDPNPSPSDSFILMGARNTGNSTWMTCNYGYFVAVDPATGQLAWRQAIPQELDLASVEEINRGQISIFPKMAFTADGTTAYTAGDVGGEGDSGFQGTRYGYFYSLNTSKENVAINQPPSATLLSPGVNANFPLGATINIVAAVQDDNNAIDRVEVYYTDGTLHKIATLTTPDANGRYTTDFKPEKAGGYGFFVVAYDKGNLAGDTILHSVRVENAAPTVTWVSPTNGAVIAPPPASLTLKVHGTDRDGTVVKAEFYTSATGHLADDLSPDANGDFEVEWTNPPAGQHTLNTFITDDGGSRVSRSITININDAPTPTPTPAPTGQPPVVNITSPTDGTTAAPSTNVNVTATASDPDGTIARVDFYQVNGSSDSLFSTDFNAPYTATISSSGPTIFNLVAVATDNNGNQTRSTTVRVFFQYPDTDPQGQLTISGRIRHQQSAPAHEIFLPNAVVRLNLNNSFLKATRTDAQGNFFFGSLSRGGRYELKPDEPAYEFFPPSVTWEGLTQNETWDFVAAGPLPPGTTPTPTPGSGALTWERFYDGPQHLADFDSRIAVDAQGNSFVAATSGSATDGDTDITLVKYSPTGTLLWSTSYVGEGNYKDWASDVKTDADGNVYVVGTSWAAAFPGSEYDIVTLKYNAAGQR